MGESDKGISPGRTAAVTGASSGLGAIFARKLAQRGYDLLLIARRQNLLAELGEKLRRDHSVAVELIPADLSKGDHVQRVQQRIAETANLEILINNAGFGMLSRFAEADLQRQLDMIAVHVLAGVRLTRAALPGMIGRGRGAIINVSSIAAFRGVPGKSTYSATKAYLNVFSEALRMELKGTGVYVQSLCPGFTYTGFHDTAEFKFDRSAIPKGLWMPAEDVVDASLKAMDRRRGVCIPGWKNRLYVRLSRGRLSGRILSALFNK